MTALELLNALKADARNVMWLNHDRREAAFHAHNAGHCVPCDYADAKMARTDPALRLVEECDGEIWTA